MAGCSNDITAPKTQPHRVPTFLLISVILSKEHKTEILIKN